MFPLAEIHPDKAGTFRQHAANPKESSRADKNAIILFMDVEFIKNPFTIISGKSESVYCSGTGMAGIA